MEKKCENCGNRMYEKDYPSRRGNSFLNQRFCSRKCFSEYRIKNTKRIDVVCSTCGKKITRRKKQILSNQRWFFCSKVCKYNCKEMNEAIVNKILFNEGYLEYMNDPSKFREYKKGVHYSPETEFKPGWQHTQKGKEMIKKAKATLGGKGMTMAEKRAQKIIKENHYPFNFVGDGKLIIGTKNPDFIYVNDGRKIIEVFSDYWHREDVAKYWHQTEEGCKIYYDLLGYNVLIIWEKELKEPKKVAEKIKNFVGTTIEFDVSERIKKEFITFAEDYWDSNRGNALKFCLEQALEYQSMKITFFDNINFKLDSILANTSQTEQTEEKPETSEIRMLNGRIVKKEVENG